MINKIKNIKNFEIHSINNLFSDEYIFCKIKTALLKFSIIQSVGCKYLVNIDQIFIKIYLKEYLEEEEFMRLEYEITSCLQSFMLELISPISWRVFFMNKGYIVSSFSGLESSKHNKYCTYCLSPFDNSLDCCPVCGLYLSE